MTGSNSGMAVPSEPTAADYAAAGKVLSGFRRILVVSHVNPDSDAYGSSLGLGLAMRDAGHEVTVINEQGTAGDRQGSFPGLELIVPVRAGGAGEGLTFDELTPDRFDLLVYCDSASQNRTGDHLGPVLLRFEETLNIDHHISNTGFARRNLIDVGASSTSEMVFRVLESMNVHISAACASALYCGISGDTGSFRYSATTPQTFSVASRLTELGADPAALAEVMYGNQRISAVRLQCEALLAMNLEFGGRMAEVVVTQSMLSRHGADVEDADYLVERARDIEGVAVSALFKQAGELWRVSLRSRSDQHDVSKIAAQFGGGGHRRAAAFRWRKTIEELRPLLRDAVKQCL